MIKWQSRFGRKPAGILERDRAGAGFAAGSCVLLWGVYLLVYLPFLPTAGDAIGPDFALHFPNLLTGYYWFLHNGLAAIPWFSPSQCGGFPYFPDPNVAYYSVPQFLVFLVSPLRSVQLTFALFSLVSLAGTYLLMRSAFRVSRPAATLAAGIFLFNGFFVYRMLIGHLTFHAFALVPVMVAALLPASVQSRPSLSEYVWRTCVAAACFAYMFQSGMVHGILPAILATIVIFLIHGLCFGWQASPWLLLATAGALSLALCAGKFNAELALLSNFPRDSYPLPGIVGLWSAVEVAVQTLFFSPPADPMTLVTNAMWELVRAEWEYGVSVAPLLFVVAGSIVAAVDLVRRRSLASITYDRVLAIGALAVLLSIPIVLNWYEPGWNAVLKASPYFGNSSNLLRFFSAYIPIVVVVAGLGLDRLRLPKLAKGPGRLLMAAGGLGILLLQNAVSDKASYANPPYKVAPIEAAYAQAKASGAVPEIEGIGDRLDAPTTGVNDAMIKGRSQRYCYQPLLGYRLEKFPAAPLRPGPVITAIGQVINVKNPACYLFPMENGCTPGNHFTVEQVEDAVTFLTYRPFPFEQPFRQQFATWLSLLSAVGVAAAILTAAIGSLRARRRKKDERTLA